MGLLRISIAFLCIKSAVTSLGEYDNNFCYDAKVDQHYCCTDYEEINGTCVACKIGFTTGKGRPCRPCPINRYGDRCVLSCYCTRNQRCDNVVGCISVNIDTTLVPGESNVSVTLGTDRACKTGFTSLKGRPCRPCSINRYGDRCALSCNCNRNQRCHNVIGCISYYINTTFAPVSAESTVSMGTGIDAGKINENEPLKAEIWNNEWFIYSIIATGIILLLLPILIIGCCEIRKDRNRRTLNQNIGDVQNSEFNEGFYHTIDDNVILDPITSDERIVSYGTNRDSSWRTVTLSQNIGDENNIEVNEGLYNTIADTVILELTHSDRQNMPHGANTDSSSNSSSIRIAEEDAVDGMGYLHPYHSLLTSMPNQLRNVNELDRGNVSSYLHLLPKDKDDLGHERFKNLTGYIPTEGNIALSDPNASSMRDIENDLSVELSDFSDIIDLK